MQLFYTADIRGNLAYLPEDESRHLTQVLRRKVGDTIQITDGKGHLFQGNIVEISKKHVVLSIQEQTSQGFPKRDFKLHIAIAPTKNIDRFEWFLEKATEIGIDEITPLIAKRSERTVIKWERLNGILISAMKQSIKTDLPKLNESIGFTQFMRNDFSQYDKKFIAHCMNVEKHPLSKTYEKSQNALILIGPEGDFTEEEVRLAASQNFVGISLGNSRLRTETAGIVACHTINIINE